MITKKITELLKQKEFISVATCDFAGRPNAAPKFLLKVESSCVYLVDYTIGKTCENLRVNPRASLSFMDTENLIGYQINGPVELIESGQEFDKLMDEFKRKETDLSVQRIIEGVTQGKAHKAFELAIPEKFVVFKVKIEEAVEIGARGDLKREKV